MQMSVDGDRSVRHACAVLLLQAGHDACAPFMAAIMVAAALAGHVLQSRPSLNPDKSDAGFFQESRPWRDSSACSASEGWINLLKGLLQDRAWSAWRSGPSCGPNAARWKPFSPSPPSHVVGDMSHLLFKVLIDGAGRFVR